MDKQGKEKLLELIKVYGLRDLLAEITRIKAVNDLVSFTLKSLSV